MNVPRLRYSVHWYQHLDFQSNLAITKCYISSWIARVEKYDCKVLTSVSPNSIAWINGVTPRSSNSLMKQFERISLWNNGLLVVDADEWLNCEDLGRLRQTRSGLKVISKALICNLRWFAWLLQINFFRLCFKRDKIRRQMRLDWKRINSRRQCSLNEILPRVFVPCVLIRAYSGQS